MTDSRHYIQILTSVTNVLFINKVNSNKLRKDKEMSRERSYHTLNPIVTIY